jgi:beta-barrel assembly-enhancing protease
MKTTLALSLCALTLAASTAAAAPTPAPTPTPGTPQLGGIMKGLETAKKARELIITDEDEAKLGQGVSEKVRARYGVVQDVAVHKYVTLVGMALAQSTKRPNLPWTFIVLDTDGVNAFAAPGGYIHITRGALGLLKSESELAGVLAHEITHVVEKHTIAGIKKSKGAQFLADATLKDPGVFQGLVDSMTEAVLSGFGRNEELESDREGLRLANRVGYSPAGLGMFLTRLTDRNSASSEKQGLFASHPEMKERLDKLAAQIVAEKLNATATLEDRYKKNISYTAKALTEIAPVAGGAAGLAGGSSKSAKEEEKPEPKKKGFGLGSLIKPTGSEKKSAEVSGSGAARGVNTELNAKGGSNPKLVAVTVTPGDVAAFLKEGKLK